MSLQPRLSNARHKIYTPLMLCWQAIRIPMMSRPQHIRQFLSNNSLIGNNETCRLRIALQSIIGGIPELEIMGVLYVGGGAASALVMVRMAADVTAGG